jgi:hypothetical protein
LRRSTPPPRRTSAGRPSSSKHVGTLEHWQFDAFRVNWVAEWRGRGTAASTLGAEFKVDCKVTHCGHDSFHMLRENGVWKLEGGASR